MDLSYVKATSIRPTVYKTHFLQDPPRSHYFCVPSPFMRPKNIASLERIALDGSISKRVQKNQTFLIPNKLLILYFYEALFSLSLICIIVEFWIELTFEFNRILNWIDLNRLLNWILNWIKFWIKIWIESNFELKFELNRILN